jgi:multiple RNA-binding domain-containing protein 1
MTGSNNLKRKREEDGVDEDDKGLQEYLDVMKPPKKSRTWTNEESHWPDEDRPTKKSSAKDNASVSNIQTEVNPYPHKKEKKHKRKSKSSHEAVEAEAETSPDTSTKTLKERKEEPKKKKSKDKPKSKRTDKGGKSLDADKDSPEELDADPNQLNEPKSDADWLRSKTRRLLGLVDDEDLSDTREPPTKSLSDMDSVEDDSQVQSLRDHLIHQEPEHEQNETDSGEESTDANVDSISASGRLFIRNLPYSATDADLQEIFSPFGKLEEVCTINFSKPIPL